MKMFTFFGFDLKYFFWVYLVQKFKIVCAKWILIPARIGISRIQWWCSLHVLDWKYPFWAGFRGGSRAAATFKMERFEIIVNGFQPLTIITKRSILNVPPVLQVLSKTSFWHFHITWLISQQSIRRDLKPVAFFVFELKYSAVSLSIF